MIILQNFWSLLILFALERAIIDMKGNQTYTSQEIYENTILFNLWFPVHLFLPRKLENVLKEIKSQLVINPKDTLTITSAIESEITQCKRTVFADTTEEVNREFEYLSKYYPDIEFFKSKETLLRTERIWFFPEATIDTKLVHHVHQMIAAGIYDYLENIFLSNGESTRVNYTLMNRPEKKTSIGRREPQAISLRDKIQSCFFMYLIFISACSACFVVEIFRFNGNLVQLKQASFKCCNFRHFPFIQKIVFVIFNSIHIQKLLVNRIITLAQYVKLKAKGLQKITYKSCWKKKPTMTTMRIV